MYSSEQKQIQKSSCPFSGYSLCGDRHKINSHANKPVMANANCVRRYGHRVDSALRESYTVTKISIILRE